MSICGKALVLDTNIVLDLLVFNDTAVLPVRQALQTGAVQWLATQPMRDELARVLTYPNIVGRLKLQTLNAAEVLNTFDQNVYWTEVAAKACITCSDPDDQKFIDLAIRHKALLLSKDRAVLAMKKRLLAQGVYTRTAWVDLV